jgi:hypothetical protein
MSHNPLKAYRLKFETLTDTGYAELKVLEQISIGFSYSAYNIYKEPVEFKNFNEVLEKVQIQKHGSLGNVIDEKTANQFKDFILEYNAFGAGYNTAKGEKTFQLIIYVVES